MEESLSVSESCQTIGLHKENLFISAFPGKIVIGQIVNFTYKSNKCFSFFFYELLQLYLSIVPIITFFSSDANNVKDKGEILSRDNELLYYWIGKTFIVDKSEQKVVKIGIQFKNDIIFEIVLTSSELNNLIFCLPQTILSSLCLKDTERSCMEFLTEQSTVIIVSISDKKKCEQFIKKNFVIDSVLKPTIRDLFLYYHEILLLIHKLKTLHNAKVQKSNIEIILNC